MNDPLNELVESAEMLAMGGITYSHPIPEGHTEQETRLALALQTLQRSQIQKNRLIAQLQTSLQRAESAIQLRDEFIAIASHELKTPVTSLQVQSQALLRFLRLNRLRDMPEKTLHHMLQIGDSQVKHLSALISALLDVNSISLEELKVVPETFNLTHLIHSIVDRFASELEIARCPIELQLDDPVFGYWDPIRIEQVLTNLMGNAMKFGKGKRIRIDLSKKANEVILSITDQGIGIPERDQSRVFDRYHRASSARHFGGFGLGLYISRHIVNLHHGQIHVRSKVGEGSCFTVVLFPDALKGRESVTEEVPT